MIKATRDGEVLRIALNRPEKRNAMLPEMLDGLREEIAAAGSARALILAGEGRVFCGGFDLQQCLAKPGMLESLLRGLFETIALLRGLPIPVVAAVHGAAIAGGCALLGGADVILADRNAKLGYPVTPLGISPAVSAPFLRLLVGDGAARARLLEPTLVSGEAALKLGLIHEIVETPEAVQVRASEIAAGLAAKPPGAMAATRGWLAEIEERFSRTDARAGLAASLSLVNGPEERQLLAALLR